MSFMRVQHAPSPFPPGTTAYMQIGDPDGLGDGDAAPSLNLGQIMQYVGLGHGYLRAGIPGAIGYAIAGRLFPKATAVLIGVQHFSHR